MNITIDDNTLLAIIMVAGVAAWIITVRTRYQLAALRHRASTAAQWDRLARDVLADAASRSRPVHVTADSVTLNPK